MAAEQEAHQTLLAQPWTCERPITRPHNTVPTVRRLAHLEELVKADEAQAHAYRAVHEALVRGSGFPVRVKNLQNPGKFIKALRTGPYWCASAVPCHAFRLSSGGSVFVYLCCKEGSQD